MRVTLPFVSLISLAVAAKPYSPWSNYEIKDYHQMVDDPNFEVTWSFNVKGASSGLAPDFRATCFGHGPINPAPSGECEVKGHDVKGVKVSTSIWLSQGIDFHMAVLPEWTAPNGTVYDKAHGIMVQPRANTGYSHAQNGTFHTNIINYY